MFHVKIEYILHLKMGIVLYKIYYFITNVQDTYTGIKNTYYLMFINI